MKKALLALVAAGVLMSSFATQAFFGGCCNNGRTSTCKGCRYEDTGNKWKLEQ